MKFQYEYRTRDNVRHTGVVSASSRDAAYAKLKAQGIRPGSVVDAPGLANKIFGKGKRWLAICFLAAALLVTVSVYLSVRSTVTQLDAQLASFDSPMRRQIIGDSAVIEKGIRTGWADIFEREGDRFLASFAVPGVPAGQRNTSEDELLKVLDGKTAVKVQEPLPLEARQIVAIVVGMKTEIRELLAAEWTAREVGRALVKRQEKEIGYYERTKAEIETAKESNLPDGELEALLAKKNSELRNMGIRLVAMPE